jgi:cleavage stimulation factor subunit 3
VDYTIRLTMSGDYDPSVQGNAWDDGDDGEYGVEGGSDHTEDSKVSSHQDDPSFSLEQVPRASGDVPSASNDDDGASDTADYDPEMITTTTVPAPAAKPSPKPQAKKPKTAGGFIMDSDSEDDEDSGPGSSGLAVPNPSGPTHVHSASSMQTPMTAHGAASPTVPSQTHPAKLQESPSGGLGDGHASVVPGTSPSAQPREGQDKITMLEGIIRDDPRGAMDAWLALLREYRDRNRIDDARNAYERFLETVPQAVSITQASRPRPYSHTVGRFALVHYANSMTSPAG